MKNAHRLLVITEAGKVVGTQVLSEAPNHGEIPAGAMLRSGPAQRHREIEIDILPTLRTTDEIDAFHRHIEERLELDTGSSGATNTKGG